MIIFVCGDKGGVSKSTTASAVVDYLMRHKRPVFLVEGDKNQPDVSRRFAGRIGVGELNLNQAGAADAAIARLGTFLEEKIASSTTVVVNLPATSGDTLNQHAGIIGEVCGALGHEVVVGYCLGQGAAETASVGRSIDAGLLSIAGRRYVLMPEHLGRPTSFNWSKSSVRDQYLDDGGHEMIVPAFRPDHVRDKVFAIDAPWSSLTGPDCKDLFIVERSQLFRWMKRMDVVAEELTKPGEET